MNTQQVGNKGLLFTLLTGALATLISANILTHIADRKIEALEKESEELNDNIRDNEDNIDDLNSELSNTQEGFDKVTEELETLESEHGELEEKLEEAESEKSKLEKDIEEKDKKLKTLSSSNTQDSGNKQSNSKSETGQTFSATHYTAGCEGCSGITATGVDVRNTIYHNGMRVIAVDPSVIPLNTIVQVTYPNGTSFKAIAVDTGGAIKGNIIDILVETKSEAYQLGRQSVTIEIL